MGKNFRDTLNEQLKDKHFLREYEAIKSEEMRKRGILFSGHRITRDGKIKLYYCCRNCGTFLYSDTLFCPTCNAEIDWSNERNERDNDSAE